MITNNSERTSTGARLMPIVCLLVLMISCTAASAKTTYVDADSPRPDGSSWPKAHRYIRSTLSAASEGDELSGAPSSGASTSAPHKLSLCSKLVHGVEREILVFSYTHDLMSCHVEPKGEASRLQNEILRCAQNDIHHWSRHKG